MTSDHADFYLGTGPNARWLGSLAEFGSPAELAGLTVHTGHSETAGVFSGTDPGTYEATVAALLTQQHATKVGFVAVPDLGEKVGWPWLATTSSGWYAYAFADGHVRVSFHGGPWFTPDPRRPDGGAESATGPDAELLSALGDTTPKTATFTYTGLSDPVDPGHGPPCRRCRRPTLVHRGQSPSPWPAPRSAASASAGPLAGPRRRRDPQGHARPAATRPRSRPLRTARRRTVRPRTAS